MIIKGARVYRDHQFTDSDIRLQDGKIVEIAPHLEGVDVIDARGLRALPGFIDIHTHGGMHVDVNHITKESLDSLCRFFASVGTTSFLASVMTDTHEKTLQLLDLLGSESGKAREGATLLGIHLEGPFLSPAYKGAMPERCLKKGDAGLLEEYLQCAKGNVRYVTIAPEVEGAIPLIERFHDRIPFAIGHSGADFETAMRAIRAGAVSTTHLFNAMGLFHMHRPAISGAALLSDIYVETICDGRHLHPATVALVLKTKGWDKVVAITDCIMATGLPDGEYQLGQDEVIVKDGDAKTPEGVRAGSTLTTIQALRNIMAYTPAPMETVVPLLTENPAKLIGVWNTKGSITPGKDADLLLVDGEAHIKATIIGGRIVYKEHT